MRTPPADLPILPPSFYARPAAEVARALLGQILCRDDVRLEITEVEAYGGPEDSASHARAGRTPRNEPMWGPPGRAYVYLCYGLHHLLNVATGPEGQAGAVLVRAARAIAGLDCVRDRRGGRLDLAGPGKVAAALGLDRGWNGHPLHEPGGLEIRAGRSPRELLAGPRIGIDYARPADRRARLRFAAGEGAPVSVPRSDLAPLRVPRGSRAPGLR